MEEISIEKLNDAFRGTDFGNKVNSNTDEKLKYTLKALTERLYDYHTGSAITHIMIELKLLTPKSHLVTKRGKIILRRNLKKLT
jgi:hypothetical protein